MKILIVLAKHPYLRSYCIFFIKTSKVYVKFPPLQMPKFSSRNSNNWLKYFKVATGVIFFGAPCISVKIYKGSGVGPPPVIPTLAVRKLHKLHTVIALPLFYHL